MAKQKPTADVATAKAEPSRAGRIVDLAFRPFEMFGSMVGKLAEAVFRDGTLEAAGRQGIDELGGGVEAVSRVDPGE